MKRKIRVCLFLALTLMVIAGCGSKKEEPAQKENGTKSEETKKEPEQKEPEKDEADNEDQTEQEEPKIQKITTPLYCVNGETGEIGTKDLEWTQGDYEELWGALISTGIITEDCKINKFEENKNEKSLLMDVNTAFGERLRSMGAAGETEILTCVVNTYLKAYESGKIKITEEGQALRTGHALLDDYLSEY